ncbi:hypothetical protein GQ600_5044 [Phytophthora cactorum]|nr:hypothetical protein GQ600_5044 [Phytophthora cactorum]
MQIRTTVSGSTIHAKTTGRAIYRGGGNDGVEGDWSASDSEGMIDTTVRSLCLRKKTRSCATCNQVKRSFWSQCTKAPLLDIFYMGQSKNYPRNLVRELRDVFIFSLPLGVENNAVLLAHRCGGQDSNLPAASHSQTFSRRRDWDEWWETVTHLASRQWKSPPASKKLWRTYNTWGANALRAECRRLKVVPASLNKASYLVALRASLTVTETIQATGVVQDPFQQGTTDRRTADCMFRLQMCFF